MNSNSSKSPDSMKSKRWYWLDWLRVLAMATIFLYHSGRPFVPFDWPIMNPEPDPLFTLANVFVTGWIMPLFFVVSGMSVYFSLAKRSHGQFLKERFKRLMIPFIFALFVILPVDRYFDSLFSGYFTGSFTGFYFWEYFNVFPFTFDLSLTYLANSTQGLYLWYLFWLFVFSLITVHLFKYLRKDEVKQRISKMAAICNRRGGIFLLAIPIMIVDIISIKPYFEFPSFYGGWKLPTYLVFFILAYVIASDSEFEESIKKNVIPALVMGIISSIAIIVLFVTIGEEVGQTLYIPFSILWAFNGWCWVIAILGFGRKRLNFDHKYLKTANELVLPFYVLHETIIIAIAFYVVGLDMIVIGKYLIIVTASFAIIGMLLLPIRQINVLRFLFGMRLKEKRA